ncbi:MAG: tryptophan transporter [Bacillota bacterium]
MNLRKNILTALLIAIGLILHQVIPGTIGSMKFDMLLSVIFVALLINQDGKNAVVTALLGGIITAMTTTFPGGQLPNIIDKLITSGCVFLMIKGAGRFRNNSIVVGAISFIGTIISGVVFLTSAFYIVGLPAPFKALFLGIVLPTAVTNILVTLLIYHAVKLAMKATGMKFVQS